MELSIDSNAHFPAEKCRVVGSQLAPLGRCLGVCDVIMTFLLGVLLGVRRLMALSRLSPGLSGEAARSPLLPGTAATTARRARIKQLELVRSKMS